MASSSESSSHHAVVRRCEFEIEQITGVLSYETAFIQYTSTEPILLRSDNDRPVKDDCKWLGAPYGENNLVSPGSEWTPSFVQDPSQIWFGPVTPEQLYNGGTLTTSNKVQDTNGTEATWRLTIRKNGAWRAPFHAHASDEQWIVTRGKWYFQWFDPCNGLVSVDGCKITFDERGFPTAPNSSAEFCRGDIIMMQLGTFFRWGSDDPCAQIMPTWPCISASGAINVPARIVRDIVTGRITPMEGGAQLAEFQLNYMTFFVAPIECIEPDECDRKGKCYKKKSCCILEVDCEKKGKCCKKEKNRINKPDCEGPCTVVAPSIRASTWERIFEQYKPQSPIFLRYGWDRPRKKDKQDCTKGKTCKYLMKSPSLVQNECDLFIKACPEQLQRGCQLVTVFYSPTIHHSLATLRLKVRKGGAWQTPFLSFFAETRLSVIDGPWTVRWYSKDGSPYDFNNNKITFNARGYPSGPNKELVLCDGDTILFKRGTFFQWGSSTKCASMFVSQTGCITNGVIQYWSSVISQYLCGEICEEEYLCKIEKLQREYYTVIVPLCRPC